MRNEGYRKLQTPCCSLPFVAALLASSGIEGIKTSYSTVGFISMSYFLNFYVFMLFFLLLLTLSGFGVSGRLTASIMRILSMQQLVRCFVHVIQAHGSNAEVCGQKALAKKNLFETNTATFTVSYHPPQLMLIGDLMWQLGYYRPRRGKEQEGTMWVGCFSSPWNLVDV